MMTWRITFVKKIGETATDFNKKLEVYLKFCIHQHINHLITEEITQYQCHKYVYRLCFQYCIGVSRIWKTQTDYLKVRSVGTILWCHYRIRELGMVVFIYLAYVVYVISQWQVRGLDNFNIACKILIQHTKYKILGVFLLQYK